MLPVSELKLGKLPRVIDPRTLKLASYMDPKALPPVPDVVDYTTGVTDWPMYANDRAGDCTCAAAGHMIEVWSLQGSGAVHEITDTDVLTAYHHFSPPPADNGANELDVLNYWLRTGIGGDKIQAFVEVGVAGRTMVKTACYLFGGLYIGVALPLSAQAQVGGLWDVTSGPDAQAGSWGGHAINIVGFDADGLTCITWGQPQKMTWGWWDAYVDECYAILSDYYSAFDAKSDAQGFNTAQLRADLAQLGGSPPPLAPKGCNPLGWFRAAA